MKPLSEQNHYEILEIPRGVRGDEIERAYRLAQTTYTDDSLAGYSVFEEGDAEALRERIDAAYRVLSDDQLRGAYDDWLESRSVPGDESPVAAAARQAASVLEPLVPTMSDTDLEEMEDTSGDFDGPRLRRFRMGRGIDIEEIAGVTKVSPIYLRYLEEERFGELPAPVYVRGFVAAYAAYVGLDGRRVATSYMKGYRERHPQEPRRSP